MVVVPPTVMLAWPPNLTEPSVASSSRLLAASWAWLPKSMSPLAEVMPAGPVISAVAPSAKVTACAAWMVAMPPMVRLAWPPKLTEPVVACSASVADCTWAMPPKPISPPVAEIPSAVPILNWAPSDAVKLPAARVAVSSLVEVTLAPAPKAMLPALEIRLIASPEVVPLTVRSASSRAEATPVAVKSCIVVACSRCR